MNQEIDYCDECGKECDDFVENNEHWICHECDDAIQEGYESAMTQLAADEA
jgi:ribosomal protein L37AE/L43A